MLVVRFVDDWTVKQQVARLILLAKCLTGEEVARLTFLSTELGISSHLNIHVAEMRASVNSIAMSTVSVMYNRTFDVGCISHMLDHVGEHMNTPVLDAFVKGRRLECSHIAQNKICMDHSNWIATPNIFRDKVAEQI